MNNWCHERVGRAEQNVLTWFGYMERMEKDRLVKRIVVGSDVIDVRLKERPRTGWMDG